jgi:hypothetical protein
MTEKVQAQSKSDAVRAYLAKNPKASPTEVQRELKEEGVMVSTSLVGAIKYGGGGGKKGRLRVSPSYAPPIGKARGAAKRRKNAVSELIETIAAVVGVTEEQAVAILAIARVAQDGRNGRS